MKPNNVFTIRLSVGEKGRADQYIAGITNENPPRIGVVGVNTSRPLPSDLRFALSQYVAKAAQVSTEKVEIIDHNRSLLQNPYIGFFKNEEATASLPITSAIEKLAHCLQVKPEQMPIEDAKTISLTRLQMENVGTIQASFNANHPLENFFPKSERETNVLPENPEKETAGLRLLSLLGLKRHPKDVQSMESIAHKFASRRSARGS